MNVQQLIDLLAVTIQSTSPSERHDLSLLQATLGPFGNWTVEQLCDKIGAGRSNGHERKARVSSARQNGAVAEQFLSDYREIVARIADESISFEQLRKLASRLQGREFAAKEALALAKECGVSGARSKKQAAERLGQKLTSLKATLTKTPM